MLDPFLGIGHSALAAKHCGIGKFFAFEIDAEYLKVARNALVTDATEPTNELLQQPPRRPRKAAPNEPLLFDSL